MNKKIELIRLIRNNPITPKVLKKALELGMIPKKDLEDCAFYKGDCRNAWIAKWDAKLGVFIHLRTKFGDTFAENIPHPEDDDGYDVFCPLEKINKDY